MKVFVLGGAGRFGAPAARVLAAHDIVSQVVIAGRDLDVASTLAFELSEKARAVKVDASDEDTLASALQGFDLFVNMSGPSSELLLPSVRA
ncbi:MAG: saccharopine dehydrogenase NADP-binding domain-containing protein, partial [Dehalococcoidia bacterium]